MSSNGKAAANDAAEAIKPQTSYNINFERGLMTRTSYKVIKDEIVPVTTSFPFYGQIVKKLTIHHEDNQQEVVFTIAGRCGRKPFLVDVTAEEFITAQKLYLKLINHLPGKPPSLEPHLKKFIEPAISAITNESEMEKINAIPHTGWSPDGGSFVMPDSSVGKKNFICKLGEVEVELKNFRLLKPKPSLGNGPSDLEKAFMSLLNLKKIYRKGTIYTVIAHAFLPPLIRWVGNRIRYMYHIYGETGSKKTELAKLIMALYGPLNEAAITYKWTDTPIGAEQRAYALKDCLMLIDDLKPGTITQSHRWVAFIQAAVDAMGRKRAGIGGRARETLPPRALLLSTGETVPGAGEESYTARMIQARLDYHNDGGWNKDLAQIQDDAPLFNGLMYSYINWLLKGNGQQALETHQELQNNDTPDVKHARLRNNYVSNRLGATMFCRFCVQAGLMSKGEANVFLDNHQNSLLEIIHETAAVAHSERYSQRFVASLREAIEVGQVYVGKQPDDRPVSQQQYIGWEDDNYLYLLPGGIKLVIGFARRTGIDINIDVATLRRQLYADGLTHSSPARIKGNFFDYQHPQTKGLVIRLYQNKLWPHKNEIEHPKKGVESHEPHEFQPNQEKLVETEQKS